MYRGILTVRKIENLVLKLPRGAETWRAFGGRPAITAEVESSWLIEHALYAIAHGQAGAKGKPPEFREYPPGRLELDAKAEKTESRAEAFRAKHLNKTT